MGALMDIPEQSMFGDPLDGVSWTDGRLRFTLDALGPDEELAFDGFFVASAEPVAFGGAKRPASAALSGGAIVGTARSASWKGSFVISSSAEPRRPGESPLAMSVDGGSLPGTLLKPVSVRGPAPLVLLLAGAGTTDRNGNNYNVPGRSDSLTQLAEGLAAKGVASYRYDKRGSGEAYALERNAATSLTVHIRDAAQVLRALAGMEGFSRIVVAGMNEGAWIGAAAISEAAREGVATDGLVALGASGMAPADELRASFAELDDETRREAEAIMEALLAKKPFSEPSAALADFFAPSRRDWLESWLAFDPAAEFAKVPAPVLFIRGGEDLQVESEAFERLLAARPTSAARLIPSMNYGLKQVSTEEENYAAFTDPKFRIPPALVELVAAFIKVKPMPAGSESYVSVPQAAAK
jgi:pimeloyl-ACP methyl ester carboxylesterase